MNTEHAPCFRYLRARPVDGAGDTARPPLRPSAYEPEAAPCTAAAPGTLTSQSHAWATAPFSPRASRHRLMLYGYTTLVVALSSRSRTAQLLSASPLPPWPSFAEQRRDRPHRVPCAPAAGSPRALPQQFCLGGGNPFAEPPLCGAHVPLTAPSPLQSSPCAFAPTAASARRTRCPSCLEEARASGCRPCPLPGSEEPRCSNNSSRSPHR